MGYEPTLIIKAEDLRCSLSVIIDYPKEYFVNGDVFAFLFNTIKHPPIEFEGTSFYICHPELTSFNSDVREFLDDFNVYYKTYNG